MTAFQSAEDALNFAITREEEAARFYQDQAEKMNHPEMRQVFLDFAREELSHKSRLLQIKNGDQLVQFTPAKVADLKIADYFQSAPPVGPYMTYAEMLTVAMLKEKEAFKLYTDLAATTDDATLRALFERLATEEARHKLRFEIEYDHEMRGGE
jgi:rubrerythrin